MDLACQGFAMLSFSIHVLTQNINIQFNALMEKEKSPKFIAYLLEKEERILNLLSYEKLKQISSPVKVMICSGILFLGTFLLIQPNIINYAHLPAKVKVKVPKGEGGNDTIFELKVESLQPLDTIGKKVTQQTNSTRTQQLDPTKEVWIEKKILINQNPAFLVWTMLILIMMSIVGGAFPVFIEYLKTLKQEYGFTVSIWRGRAFAFTVLVLLFIHFICQGYYEPDAILADFSILLKWHRVLPAIVIVTALLMAPSFVVVYLIGIASKNLSTAPINAAVADGRADVSAKIRQFGQLNEMLKTILQLHAIVVVFSVLTSNALGVSIRAVVAVEDFDIYPKEIPFVYGMFFSLFLCGLYVPTYMYLKSCYQTFIEKLEQAGSPDEKDRQNIIAKAVKIDGSLVDSIKLALTLLAPLLSSFLPDGFNLFK